MVFPLSLFHAKIFDRGTTTEVFGWKGSNWAFVCTSSQFLSMIPLKAPLINPPEVHNRQVPPHYLLCVRWGGLVTTGKGWTHILHLHRNKYKLPIPGLRQISNDSFNDQSLQPNMCLAFSPRKMELLKLFPPANQNHFSAKMKFWLWGGREKVSLGIQLGRNFPTSPSLCCNFCLPSLVQCIVRILQVSMTSEDIVFTVVFLSISKKTYNSSVRVVWYISIYRIYIF